MRGQYGWIVAIGLAAAGALAPAAAEVYKWVDAQGRLHYGDKPPPGAQPAELPDIQVYEGAQPRSGTGRASGAKASVAGCLAAKGAVFYGTSWCPQCARQRRSFGASAAELPYVECSVNGTRQETAHCAAKGIRAYPTWVFPDGRRQSGVLSVETLARVTGCG